MSLRGIRGTLTDFLAAGGHISAGISKALGATADTINNYISRHIIGPTVGTVDYINSIADEGIALWKGLRALMETGQSSSKRKTATLHAPSEIENKL